MGLDRYYKNDTVRIVGAAAAGYAISTYAPELKGYATTARKAVQSVRKSTFGGKEAPAKTSAQDGSIFSLFSGARGEDISRATAGQNSRIASGSAGGGLWDSMVEFLRGLLA